MNLCAAAVKLDSSWYDYTRSEQFYDFYAVMNQVCSHIRIRIRHLAMVWAILDVYDPSCLAKCTHT